MKRVRIQKLHSRKKHDQCSFLNECKPTFVIRFNAAGAVLQQLEAA
jgi:hypothetical protein